MTSSGSRGRRLKSDVKRAEFSRFPRFTLKQFRRDVGDDHCFLQVIRRTSKAFWGQCPLTFGPLNGVN